MNHNDQKKKQLTFILGAKFSLNSFSSHFINCERVFDRVFFYLFIFFCKCHCKSNNVIMIDVFHILLTSLIYGYWMICYLTHVSGGIIGWAKRFRGPFVVIEYVFLNINRNSSKSFNINFKFGWPSFFCFSSSLFKIMGPLKTRSRSKVL